jgi:hypothetical protein
MDQESEAQGEGVNEGEDEHLEIKDPDIAA